MSKYNVNQILKGATVNKAVRSQGNLNELEDITPIFANTQDEPDLLSFIMNPREEFLTTNTFNHDYQRRTTISRVEDMPYNERGDYVGKETQSTLQYQVPHFPLQGKVNIEDYVGVRQPGTDNEYDTQSRLVGEELGEMAKAYSTLDEVAFAHIITTGTVHTPNSTVPNDDFYQNYMGVSAANRPTVNFDFATADFIARTAGRDARKLIQNNANDGFRTGGTIAICGREFFEDRRTDPDERERYIRGAGLGQDPLIESLAEFYQEYDMYLGSDGILYIEYSAAIGGTELIPSDEAFIMPRNISDQIVRAYAPAHSARYVNRVALRDYGWRYENEFDGIRILRERNFIDVLQNPGVVIRATSTRRA